MIPSLSDARPRVYYKQLTRDGKAPQTGFKWPLPWDGKPGEWVEVEGEIILCRNGLHAYVDHPGKVRDAYVYECELDGDMKQDGYKVAARRARLLRRIEPTVIVEYGDRPCRDCGRIHDCYRVGRGLSWADVNDGHMYRREESAATIARLTEALQEIAASGNTKASEALAVGRG